MATIKRPKKNFATERERDQFVKNYKAKLKTEMCRNWELSGRCKFQDTCSFAHGAHELVKKKHVPPNFKTKACVQFHETGFCPYGNRCQFLHSQFSIFGKQGQMTLTNQ
jgi:butyrate response factor